MFGVFTPQNFHQIKVAAENFQFILLKQALWSSSKCQRRRSLRPLEFGISLVFTEFTSFDMMVNISCLFTDLSPPKALKYSVKYIFLKDNTIKDL